eukprot:TRINITY_DN60959_c0_g1_i1.p1 TRINITY_DN60959_c0_g1~~TRINITY_DN60959_c0_g1_i1.p1  ORF type:complete len:557 (+),score=95.92 TRINITY_DN60959_c0_g1_i1:52-1722(+)
MAFFAPAARDETVPVPEGQAALGVVQLALLARDFRLDFKTLRSAISVLVTYRMLDNPGPEANREMGRKVCDLFLQAGGIFPKVGQNLAERPDLIPPLEIRNELKRCQDELEPMDFEKVQLLLKDHVPTHEEDFPCLTPVPLASASVGQVHAFGDEHEKVLKVINTDNQEAVKSQEQGVSRLANLRTTGTTKCFIQLSAATYRDVAAEFDLIQEMRYTKFGQLMINAIIEPDNRRSEWLYAGFQVISVPETIEQSATLFTLAQQNIHKSGNGQGMCVKSSKFLENYLVPPRTKKHALKSLCALYGAMIFGWKAFHVDPHPGNIYARCVLEGRSVGRGNPDDDTYRIKLTDMFLIDWGGICIIKESDTEGEDFIAALRDFFVAVVGQAAAQKERERKPTNQASIRQFEQAQERVKEAAKNPRFGFAWEESVDDDTKVKFCMSLVSSRTHTIVMKKGRQIEPVTPQELKPHVVHLLRVMSNLGAYGSYIDADVTIRTDNEEDQEQISPEHHTDGVWAELLQREAKRKPKDSEAMEEKRKSVKKDLLRSSPGEKPTWSYW